jgi:2-polyprenyl-3-methyl-5-hydroxy-6-metoxy-1,4-benzoquinol methylase/GNAT superfamily N-acetyltransferase
MNVIEYKTGTVSRDVLLQHITACDADFTPALSSRVDLGQFVSKIIERAVLFEAWSGSCLAGIVAAYCNDTERKRAFITHVSVLREFRGLGIADRLIKNCLAHVESLGFSSVALETAGDNANAVALYARNGFHPVGQSASDAVQMIKSMTPDCFDRATKDTPDHKYAYDFDFDVMHPFMLRSFLPLMNRPGSVLELGSFQGAFTKLLAEHFQDITCVEASGEAVGTAKQRAELAHVRFYHDTFENARLSRAFDNVVLTHVLEHIEDPVLVLSRIRNEWLSEKGRLFVACPNANAPSRQIAVHMGLISHNAAVTPAERQHGHHRTYALDTLERDVRKAGLSVIHRSGIFFKALANFQWDRLLRTDIISPEYLDGCYQLGKKYPDLCSSIYLVCERGPN